MAMTEPPAGTTPTLRRVLTTPATWGIAVGLVISGEYFGWNYGWAVAGTLGFAVATAIVTVFYIAFIFSYTELTTLFPMQAAPLRMRIGRLAPPVAFWPVRHPGRFLLAPPAIAAALGAYAHFLNPSLSAVWVGVLAYVVFVTINMLGVRESAIFRW
jgi:ethanolamine permease